MARGTIRPSYAYPSAITLNASKIDTSNSEVKLMLHNGIAVLGGRIKITSDLAYNTQIASSIDGPSFANAWVLLVGYTTHNTYLTRIVGNGNNTWLAVDSMAKAADEQYGIIGTAYPTV